jgi:hypothetical protein
MVFINRPERTLDADDSVIGVGARSGVWTWERESVSGFSANKIGARPLLLRNLRRADNLRCVFVNAATSVANAPPTTGGICFRLLPSAIA